MDHQTKQNQNRIKERILYLQFKSDSLRKAGMQIVSSLASFWAAQLFTEWCHGIPWVWSWTCDSGNGWIFFTVPKTIFAQFKDSSWVSETPYGSEKGVYSGVDTLAVRSLTLQTRMLQRWVPGANRSTQNIGVIEVHLYLMRSGFDQHIYIYNMVKYYLYMVSYILTTYI